MSDQVLFNRDERCGEPTVFAKQDVVGAHGNIGVHWFDDSSAARIAPRRPRDTIYDRGPQ
jgi:hypothetical protein